MIEMSLKVTLNTINQTKPHFSSYEWHQLDGS
jgi:hypothetical protein